MFKAQFADRIIIEIENYIAKVRLCRPEKMNALDLEMFEALIAAGESLKNRDDVRAIVLYGEGKGFCAGLDISLLSAFEQGKIGDIKIRTYEDCNIFQRAALIWRDLPMPVIAALHGVVFGGGFQIALGADLRIIHPKTQLSIMEIKWGLCPDMGGTYILKQLLREDLIKELCFTGRVFDGEEAKSLGLATKLSESPLESALEIAAQIANKSPSAIRANKKLINDVAQNDRATHLLLEARLQEDLMQGNHHKEAVMAGLQKREPVFKP